MTRCFGKRFFGCVLLASMTVATAMPLPAHERATPADCHQSAIPDAAVSLSASPAQQCDHYPGSACATMVGCLAVPPALALSPARVSALPVLRTLPRAAADLLHGRLALGPPTPPPNS